MVKKQPSDPTTEQIKESLSKKKAITGPDFSKGLSTGSTLMNLAYTGRPDVGYIPGYYYYLVGNSNSGKSFLSLVAMAEASLNPHYKDYRFIVDNVEEGIQMDLERFFGKAMAERLQPPQMENGQPRHSETVEEFYFNLDDALAEGPCIYVLDSMDGLTSKAESDYFGKLKKFVRKSKEDSKPPGSYGDGKAKINSTMLRKMIGPLSRTGSILIIISQTRDNIDMFSYEEETHAGGHALEFYAQVQTWSKIKKKIKKSVNDIDREIGSACQFHIKRSRFTGRNVKVDVPIYFSHGVDDVGSCVDWLITENHWKKNGATVNASEFSFKGTTENLIQMIETENKEKQLRRIVTEVWMEIEEKLSVDRKKRY